MQVDPRDLDPTFRRNLRAIRLANQMSQAKLAEALGVAPPQINHWESGRNSPTLSTVTRICEALKCTPDELLGERTAVPNSN